MIYSLKTRNFWIMLFGDVFLIFLSYFLAYYLRFDGNIPPDSLANFSKTVIWIVPLKMACLFFFGLYKGMWRYTSIHDLINLTKASLTSSAIISGLLLITVRFAGFPRSVFIIDLFLTFLFIGGYRVGVRLFYSPRNDRLIIPRHRNRNRDGDVKRLLLVGAGNAGEKLLREINENAHLHCEVVSL
jgi:FlaA1/EpsC-like NDP-sugar epimerase